jgi:hypothetical protein
MDELLRQELQSSEDSGDGASVNEGGTPLNYLVCSVVRPTAKCFGISLKVPLSYNIHHCQSLASPMGTAAEPDELYYLVMYTVVMFNTYAT